jgi:putative glutamine amidotransferase
MRQVDPIVCVVYDYGSVRGQLARWTSNVIEADTRKEVRLAMRYADALVLTGGGDVNPELYSDVTHAEVYGTSTSRDAMELYAIRQARQRRIPIMGICRGHQLINVAYGGSLIQHVDDLKYAHAHESTDHMVNFRNRSRIGKALSLVDGLQYEGTSLHHQAVDRLGEGLVPAGWTLDGIVEVIESAPGTSPYVLGTQFHPEMDWQNDVAGEIFRHFVEQARKRAIQLRRNKFRVDAVASLAYRKPFSSGRSTYSYRGRANLWGDDELELWCELHNTWDTCRDEDMTVSERSWWERTSIMCESEFDLDEYGRRFALDNLPELPTRDQCSTPPCTSPEDCHEFKDCAADAVARRMEAEKDLPNLAAILSGKRGSGRGRSRKETR